MSAAPLPANTLPIVGAFIEAPYRRLVSYSTDRDFRSNNQAFDKIFNVDPPNLARSPYKVTDANGVPLKHPDTGSDFTFPWV